MPKDRPILFSGPMVRAILEGRKTQTRRVCRDQTPIKYWYGESLPMIPDGKEKYTGWVKDIKNVAIGIPSKCPYGKPGDRLWVRETHWKDKRDPDSVVIYAHDTRYFKYKLDGILDRCRHADFKQTALTTEEADNAVKSNKNWKKKPSIHMPRWASRINLEITDIRVERVQGLSEVDAKAEGLYQYSNGVINAPMAFAGIAAANPKMDRRGFLKTLAAFGFATLAPQSGEPLSMTHQGAFWALWDSINAKRGYGWLKNPWVWVVEFKRVTI